MPFCDTNKLLKIIKEKNLSPDIVVDPYDFTFIWVSKKYCELTGYSEQELIGKQLFFTSTQKQKKARTMEMNMLDTESDVEREIPIRKKDGQVLLVKVKDQIINFENHPYMVGRIIEIPKE